MIFGHIYFKQNRDWRRSGMAENTKLSITHSFFELETPDFAWKFVWTVWTNYEKEGGFSGASRGNSAIF